MLVCRVLTLRRQPKLLRQFSAVQVLRRQPRVRAYTVRCASRSTVSPPKGLLATVAYAEGGSGGFPPENFWIFRLKMHGF